MRTAVQGGTWFRETAVIGNLQIFTTEQSINHKTRPQQKKKTSFASQTSKYMYISIQLKSCHIINPPKQVLHITSLTT